MAYDRLPEVEWSHPYTDLEITVSDTGVVVSGVTSRGGWALSVPLCMVWHPLRVTYLITYLHGSAEPTVGANWLRGHDCLYPQKSLRQGQGIHVSPWRLCCVPCTLTVGKHSVLCAVCTCRQR